jgi:hypothetical protein
MLRREVGYLKDKKEEMVFGIDEQSTGLFTYSALAKGEVCCGTGYPSLPHFVHCLPSTRYKKEI